MHSSLIAWIMRAIPFGTIIMYGALGETVTEKSGNLNLGVPGIMYLGGFAGFASAWAYENTAANPNGFVSILIAMSCAILASMAGGLIYAFLTISLRANQNVTGLALTTFGMGVANFFGVFILNGASYSAAPIANKAFSAKLPVLSGLGALGQTVFSYGFLAYAAIALAVVLHWFLTRTRAGLNLRAVGENPATADAAGINVTLYKYLSTCIGAGICGIGGLYYVLDYNQGIWATTGQIEALGWLAVAFALVMLALFVPIPTVVKVLCLLVGCAMFAMPDFLSRVAAEGVIMQRGGAESTVSCRINAGGVDVENGAHISFDKIDRLVEDDQYFYLFQSRQMAVMIPKGSLLPANPERFAKVLAKETGKDWQQPKSLWGLNLKDLIQMVKDRFHRGES